ncbi:MAG TPA: flavodoxin domain-containing protein [candidate division Zixibacteria bacterium]|nr:flavodoxin domain-containing protein [candidate division Zixibacteria bacterium]
MSKKILIVYGSRFGSTEEISYKLKQTLEKNGFFVDLVNLRSRRNKKINIHDYTGVLIGSGIWVTRWTKEAKNFLKTNIKDINERKISVGIFLSSGEASEPEKRPEVVEKYLKKVFTELGLDLGDHVLYDAFGGVYDLSKTTNLNWINRKMLRMVAQEDPKIDLYERRDYRDWNQINDFINHFISKIQ